MSDSLLGLDRHLPASLMSLVRLNPDRNVSQSMTRRIILPGEVSQSADRDKFIEQFLKNWLTDKQLKGMGGWYTEMLDTFMTDVLLHAQKVGIEKLLIKRSGNVIDGATGDVAAAMRAHFRRTDSKRLPLAIVTKEPIKPTLSKVTLEEVGGDLASETKSVLLSDVKIDENAK